MGDRRDTERPKPPPSSADVAERLGKLNPKQLALLAKRIKQAGAGSAGAARGGQGTIEALPADRGALSFGQERIWFLTELQPDSPAYNMPGAVRLRGKLDVRALAETLSQIVDRHEVLRTRYEVVDGRPRTAAGEATAVPVPVFDLSGVAQTEQQRASARCAIGDAGTPFDLARGPVLRAAVLRLAPDEHVLQLTMHHIAADEWSVGVLLREFAAIYSARAAGVASALPELPIQYGDYARWQRGRLRGELLERLLAFWRQRLSGAPTVMELPRDRPRPPVQTYRGSKCRTQVAVPKVGELARAQRATPFIVTLSAVAAFLSRYSGQQDLVIGTPVANRAPVETEGLVGFFANTVPLRIGIAENATLRRVVDLAREVVVSAQDHQELPFERLVDGLGVERDPSRSPVFQVLFVYQAADPGPIPLPGLVAQQELLPTHTAKFDLTIIAQEAGSKLSIELEYNIELFDRATMLRMLEHLTQMLPRVTEQPDVSLRQLWGLPAAEHRQVVDAWNDTAADYPLHIAVHELVDRVAARSPDVVALAFDSSQVTYAALGGRSAALARQLLRSGAGADTLVAVCVDRSIEMVVALLAVLRAGAGYLPLDPAYPSDRLGFMLEDAAPMLLLAASTLASSLPWNGETLLLDAPVDHPDELPPMRGRRFQSMDVAYVIYTSGSTGRPKGVPIHHRGLTNLVLAQLEAFAIDAHSRLLQFAPLSFDASVSEIFTALCCGATLVVAARENILPGAALQELLDRQAISVVTLPPSALAVMPEATLAALVTLVCAGEPLTPDLAARWRHGRRIVNAYGPTEVTVCATAGDWGGDTDVVPIGGPIRNVRVHVLDSALDALPSRVAGELFVESVGLSPGYLRRPQLAAERFLPASLSAEAGARMYRTGDVARWRGSGELEFLGRADQQVKVRGFRIEPGEIESVLVSHPAVADVTVVARQDAANDKRLVAYVVFRPDATCEASALREHARSRLPEYMIPSAIVVLPALPLTPNGKVDRKALPRPDVTAALISEYVEPRVGTEQTLAAIWADVLGAARVGASDDFFELGGHSLLATQVVSRVRAAFATEVPLRAMFEARTVAALASVIDRHRADAPVGTAAITRMPANAPRKLSFGQERLWFLSRLQPDSAMYNMAGAVRLRGRLELRHLIGSLREVTRRHEVLRTTYEDSNGSPRQVVAEGMSMQVHLVDFSDVPARLRERGWQSYAVQEARRPFDLRHGPVMRAQVVRLSAAEHVLLVTMHHIASDGWSIGLLIREVTLLYDAFSAGHPSPLPDLQIQYADYASWQRDWLAGSVLERQLAFWKAELAGAPAALELPTDRPRPRIQNDRGGTLRFELGAELVQRLQALAQNEHATLFMVVLALWQLLLARYSGQRDIVVGTPIANRTRADTEALIGFFVNMLALRTDVCEQRTFRQLVGQVKDACLRAYAHQDVPFERVVDELSPERDLGRTPVFQVMLVLQNMPQAALAIDGFELEPVETDTGTSKVDLTLTLTQAAGGALAGALEFNSDLFDLGTIERMSQHLEVLLRSVVTSPDAAVGDLPLLGEAERNLVIDEWNRTEAELPAALVHEQIEARVAGAPHAIAVEFDGAQLDYAELNRRANQVARWLRDRSVTREARVGVYMERSLELVVALLAVVKAGAAYVPLDPSNPAERLAFMIDDSSLPMVLTHARPSIAPLASTAAAFDLDSLLEQLVSQPGGDLPNVNDPYDLVYVIYTSGSTGKPKGAMNVHRGLANRLAWTHSAYPLAPDDCVLQKTPFGFDVSVWEFFWPLMVGARLVVARPGGHQDPEYVAHTIEERNVSMVHFVPSMLEVFVDHVEAGRCRALRHVITSGEALKPELEGRYFAKLAARLHNLYGPTEASIDVTYWDCDRADRRRSVPIGRPIANTRAYVLDRQLQPTPIGVPGELYIGGVGLARGYWNRPELTADRFVRDPFSAEPTARMYRTGDVARWLGEGVLEYLGRTDHQVKLRGFRIELGEIESRLLEHPGVRETVVVASDTERGDTRLVAYVVPSSESGGLSWTSLQQHLKSTLPDYMVPASFVELDALPLSPNGKVDRKALRSPEVTASLSSQYVEPRPGTEQTLAAIWADVLGAPRIGADDDFFELGGHSLLATQVVSRVRAALAIEVPLRAVFEARTVAALASVIDRHRADAPVGAALITRMPPDAPRTLSFGQERLWFLHQLEPESAAYNMPGALRLVGTIDVSALGASLKEVARRHEVLRTAYEASDGIPRAVVHDPTVVPVLVMDLRGLAARDAATTQGRCAMREARRPFDLARAPLLRAALLRMREEEHALLLTMHHIASDGWSLGVLVGEVTALYRAHALQLCQGRSPLPELPFQYADYARWQRNWLSGEVLERQLSYWKAQLSDAPATLELPTDHPRTSARTDRGARIRFTVPLEVSTRAAELAREQRATVFMVLVANWQLLMSRYSGQHDIVVGTPIANRTRADTEGLIGFFVNTIALRTRLSGAVTFREVIASVRDHALAAYAHQDVPFDRLVDELEPERQLGRSAIFQTMLVLDNTPPAVFDVAGLELSELDVETHATKFDLTLRVNFGAAGIAGAVDYAADLFEPATIRRLIGHLLDLFSDACAHPDARASQLELLTDAERRALLVEWNDTEEPYPDACLHELFERQVTRTPDSVALVFEDEQLSFHEVNRRANRLARRIRQVGRDSEPLVAICLERSAEVVVALLAVLKSGHGYSVIDSALPPERMRLIVEDTRASVAVVDGWPHGGVFDGISCIEVGDVEAGPADDTTVGAAVDPGGVAYVLYTSGSTGTPKGVAIGHRPLVNYVAGVTRRLSLPVGESFATVSTFAADLGNTTVFPPLCFGGTLHVISRDRAIDGHAFAAYMSSREVSCLKIVPSHLSTLLSSTQSAAVLPTKRLVLGGEASSWELIGRIAALRPGCMVANHYGPTETTVGVSTYALETSSRAPSATVPIGKPLPNSRTYVLDGELSPVPIGVPGQLFVGGAGLASGYLGDPVKTAAAFRPSWYADVGSRLYVTGDLVRRLADGSVEFLGRVDHQVKIRGYRIELGEVEATISRHPAVAAAVAVVRGEGDARRVIAYFVSRGPGQDGVDAVQLAAFLADRLPDYMVPAWLVRLDELPLTANGKIDRRLLPAPETAAAAETNEPAAMTEVELGVATIWKQLLQVEHIRSNHSFFELGGQSLLAMQAMARLRHTFGVELPVRAMFESPTVSALALRVERAMQTGAAVQLPITPVPRNAPLELSFGQERMWFLHQLEGNSAAYNVPASIRIHGGIDVERLELALTEVAGRHDVLRTTIRSVDGRPVQDVAEALCVRVALIDMTAVPDASAVRAVIAAEVSAPFDLAVGPVIRATLLRLAASEHVLIVNIHHIASDAWSRRLLVEEVVAIYGGARRSLPALTVQYADYAHWQRTALDGRFERQLAFWKEQLDGMPSGLALPTDRARPSVQSFRGASRTFEVSSALTAALRTLATRENVTMFMALLAALDMLLARYSGQHDITVGTPISNRSRAELEHLIGFFVNTLVMRTSLAGRPSYRGLLARVRRTALDAYTHQELPFERLVSELQPGRDLGTSPLFQVMLVVQSERGGLLRGSGMAMELEPVETGTSKFDLLLSITEGAAGLECTFEYATDLFDPDSIDRMAGHFARLLEAAVAAPDAEVACLPMMSVDELRQLSELNRTAAAHPVARVEELVALRARADPDAVAVACGGAQLTYRALLDRTGELSAALRVEGAAAGTAVGICVERSLEMAVTVLAVLSTGAAYVPLDRSYPTERLSYMLAEAAPIAVVTQRHLRSLLAGFSGSIIEIEATTGPYVATRGSRAVEDLTYVIYTSGSTGRPKGVKLGHRALCNLLAWQQRVTPIRQGARVLQFASINFDVSFQEMFSTWAAGGLLVIVSDEVRLDPTSLLSLMTAEDVERLFVPFVALQELAATIVERGASLPSLREVITAGERLVISAPIAAAFAEMPRCVLRNQYGPSEAHVVTEHVVTDVPTQLGGLPPIGRPIDNVQIHVLDDSSRQLPTGVAGELYIGGVCLADGYARRGELTAERFVPDPFGVAGQRLYRTGDQARYRRDGAIEYLGRNDDQVKIRGFRVELAEIEATILQFDGIAEAAVVAPADDRGNKRLVAYIVAAANGWDDAGAFREYLKARLPDYMVPTAIVQLDALERTPSGKVDRRALPSPDAAAFQSAPYVAPRTELESMLAGIWAEVLRVERVGLCDDFFELGGHSLLATQVMSRVRTLLKLELPLRSIFEAPVLGEFVARARASVALAGHSGSVALERASRAEPLPLSFGQERLWFIDQLEPDRPTYNMPGGLRLSGPLRVSAIEHALNRMVERHEILRTTYRLQGGVPVQHVDPLPDRRLPVIDLSGVKDRDPLLRRQLARDAIAPFDLAAGPIVRATLLRHSRDEHVLAFNIHHIASDGWSAGVIVAELGALYGMQVRGDHATQLPVLTVQYADYAVWQRTWLRGAELERQRAYWVGKLADAPPALELPTDRPRPPLASYRGGRVGFALDSELTQGLRELSRREGVTLFMTLLASFQTLLLRYSGQTTVLVGVPIANRTRLETEGLIGFFANTLAIRADSSAETTCRQLLGRAREATLEAYAHQDLPFEVVVKELRPERHMGRAPLFQTMFVFQNTPAASLLLEGLELQAMDRAEHVAKFDLTLTMTESDRGIDAALQYSADLFDAGTIQRMAEHYRAVLRGFLEYDGPIAEMPLVSDAERAQIVSGWNETSRLLPDEECVHVHVGRQASATPDAIAVACGPAALSYRELDRQANRLAQRLRREGVGAEVVVAVFVRRSVEMLIAVLGILKAGGAYLPLDPAYPADRLRYMVRAAGTRVLLTTRAAEMAAAALGDVETVIALDGDAYRQSSVIESDSNPSVRLTGDNLAYAIFTSGSTGMPKGVLLHHRGLLNLALSQIGGFRIDARSRVLQFAAFSFDASVSEIFTAWLAGAELYVEPVDSMMEAPVLEVLTTREVTTVTLPPSLLTALPDAALPSVETLVTAGEACTPEVVRRWRSSRNLVNAYGPTEITVCATMGDCVEEPRPPAIGRPIDNARTYVVDSVFQPVPVGVTGELVVGGVGVARAYRGQPDLTAAKFVPDPFSGPGARVYRTGDLAKHRSDGAIDYIGRADAQVKVRGFRVELAEIEGALLRAPGVHEAVVVVQGDSLERARLVAFVVAEDAAARSALVELAKVVPAYMVPSAIIATPSLPRAPSGKVDRAALARLAPAQRAGERTRPDGATEERLAAVWRRALGLEEVGTNETFFELGGHSLLAVRVAADIEREFGVRVPLTSFFVGGTIRDVARLLSEPRAAGGAAIALTPGETGPPVFCVHPIGGRAMWYRALASELRTACFGLEAPSLDGDAPPSGSVGELAEQHLREMMRLQPTGPYRLLGWSFGGVVAFEIAHRLRALEREVSALVLIDAHLPDVDAEPPDENLMLAMFLGDLARASGRPIDDVGAGIDEGSGASDPAQPERFEAAMDWAARAGILPREVPVDAWRRAYAVFRANVIALARYRPTRYDGPVTYIQVPESAAAAAFWAPFVPRLEVQSVAASHFTVLQPPAVDEVAALLRARLGGDRR